MPAVHALRADPHFVPVAPPDYRRSVYAVMRLVAGLAGMSVEYLTAGHHKAHAAFNARSAVAVLSMEFCPKIGAGAVDRALRLADGVTLYYRRRHADRCALYPDYRQLYIKARMALMAASS